MYVISDDPDTVQIIPSKMSPELHQAIQSVRFIAQHIKDADKDNEVRVFMLMTYTLSFVLFMF